MDEDTLRLLAEEIAKVNIRDIDDPCSLFDWIAEMFTDEHPTMKQRVDATILADKAITKVAQAALTALQDAGLVIVPVEPTEFMKSAGGYSAREYDRGFQYSGEEVAEMTWRSMIEAKDGTDKDPYDAHHRAMISPMITNTSTSGKGE